MAVSLAAKMGFSELLEKFTIASDTGNGITTGWLCSALFTTR